MSKGRTAPRARVVRRASNGKVMASGEMRPALPPEPIVWRGTGQTFIPATEAFAPSFDRRFRVVPRADAQRLPRQPLSEAPRPIIPAEISPRAIEEGEDGPGE